MDSRWVVGVTLLLAGCGYPPAGSAPGPLSPAAATDAKSRFPDATPDSLEKGRQLFLSHCNKCHGYPDVSKLPDEKLSSVVPRMGKKADLGPEDTELVLRFVLTERAAGTAPAAH